MTEQELKNILDKFRGLPSETEWLEFKSAENSFDFNKLGKYFSALSNEANLKKQPSAWLIFGIDDKTKKIKGSQFRPNRASLDSLKSEVANHTTANLTFTEIYDIQLPEGRVVMFQIPPAPMGIPIAWKGHFYGRNDEELGALNIQEIEDIRSQVNNYDWSGEVVEQARLEDLSEEAIAFARKQYANRYGNTEEVSQWDDITFLNKAYVTRQGKITNAAILLLGKPESRHFLLPAQPSIIWVLRNEHNQELGHEHFFLPFILVSNKLYIKIRNLKYVYMPDNTLFPNEVDMYDPFLIRESLHNCIAHQDYLQVRRVNIVEYPNQLIFTNPGDFIPHSIQEVISMDAPPDRYRNPFLVNAMMHLNMIETRGGGIRKMFDIQRKRYFPMPDYDFSKPSTVKMKIYGKILDKNYSKLLIANPEINLETAILLDFIQKGKSDMISEEEIKQLKSQKLIGGRKPHYSVSLKTLESSENQIIYADDKTFKSQVYKKYIIEHIKKHGSATRHEINELLLNSLPELLSTEQKNKRIENIIQEMSGKEIINVGARKTPKWIIN